MKQGSRLICLLVGALLIGALLMGISLVGFSLSTNYWLSVALLTVVGVGQATRMSATERLERSR